MRLLITLATSAFFTSVSLLSLTLAEASASGARTAPVSRQIALRPPLGPHDHIQGSLLANARRFLSSEQSDAIRIAYEKFRSAAGARNLSDREVQEVADNLIELLQAPDALVDYDTRGRLVEQILSQAAMPHSVNQGKNNTCSVAALESRLYWRQPAIVAQMIKELAITGVMRCADGREIWLDQDAMRPDAEATARPTPDGKRTYASQLFQLAAINAYWQRQSRDPRGYKLTEGTIRYTQKDEGQQSSEDTGERMIIDYGDSFIETVVTDDGRPVCHPSFTLATIHEVSRFLTGQREPSFCITAERRLKGEGVTCIKSANDLRRMLSRLRATGNLPAVVAIEAGAGAIPSSLRTALVHDGWHVVNLLDVDEASDKVAVDNWWGELSDRLGRKSLAVEDFYPSMLRSATLTPNSCQEIILRHPGN